MPIADHLPHHGKTESRLLRVHHMQNPKKYADIIRMRHQMIDFKGVGAWRSVIKSALRL
jgi:hypothetical protein